MLVVLESEIVLSQKNVRFLRQMFDLSTRRVAELYSFKFYM